jgi:hypothetical protein
MIGVGEVIVKMLLAVLFRDELLDGLSLGGE